MTSFPDIQRIDVYSHETPDRLEFEVAQRNGMWEASTLRLTKGRVMRAPGTSGPAPKLERICLQAHTYDELVSKCKEKFESKTGGRAEIMAPPEKL